METIRFYRKEPNKKPGHSRYRIGINHGPSIIKYEDGSAVNMAGGDYYSLFVEGEEHLGSVYIGPLSSILEQYDIVESNSVQS